MLTEFLKEIFGLPGTKELRTLRRGSQDDNEERGDNIRNSIVVGVSILLGIGFLSSLICVIFLPIFNREVPLSIYELLAGSFGYFGGSFATFMKNGM